MAAAKTHMSDATKALAEREASMDGKLLDLSGCGIARAVEAILALFPIDDFVDAPVARMQVVGDPEADMPIFNTVQAVLDRAEGRPIAMRALERFDFYNTAKHAFAIVRTSDPGPYGCFIIRKGVIRFPLPAAAE